MSQRKQMYCVPLTETCTYDAYIPATSKTEALAVARRRFEESALDSFHAGDCEYVFGEPEAEEAWS